ncbi:hypothetical protein GTQ34_15535 [Muricauda sp. JGD-17]|uniref:Uncharacterized protein n=1 Tax=Flagellimonas ochracea TaxID=2696472 RepID=A0A964WYV5_9FLAO|nr:hypothetical protein [Allomuricauda ochracea]NAY93322.1 hypothetical protein [Allomuricauda ochracea]
MKKGLFLHEIATGFEDENLTAEHYIQVGQKFTNEWLPNYWACYIYTQLFNMYGRTPDTPKDVSRSDLLNKAQEQLNIAKERYKGKDAEILSDIDALQGFVNFFKLRNAIGTKKGDSVIADLKIQYLEKLKSALQKDPENPLVYVLIGTSMVGKPDSDFREALAAKVLLNKAEELFDNETRHRALSTRWNSEWLGFFWLKNADNVLTKKLNDEAAKE